MTSRIATISLAFMAGVAGSAIALKFSCSWDSDPGQRPLQLDFLLQFRCRASGFSEDSLALPLADLIDEQALWALRLPWRSPVAGNNLFS